MDFLFCSYKLDILQCTLNAKERDITESNYNPYNRINCGYGMYILSDFRIITTFK